MYKNKRVLMEAIHKQKAEKVRKSGGPRVQRSLGQLCGGGLGGNAKEQGMDGWSAEGWEPAEEELGEREDVVWATCNVHLLLAICSYNCFWIDGRCIQANAAMHFKS